MTSNVQIYNQYIYDCLVHVNIDLNNHNYHLQHHNYPTRHNYFIVIPNVRLTKTKQWFNIIAFDMFNRLSKAAHSVDLTRFEVVLKQWLLQNPFYSISEFFDSQIFVRF